MHLVPCAGFLRKHRAPWLSRELARARHAILLRVRFLGWAGRRERVRRAGCGVRGAACGVRGAGCGVRGGGRRGGTPSLARVRGTLAQGPTACS